MDWARGPVLGFGGSCQFPLQDVGPNHLGHDREYLPVFIGVEKHAITSRYPQFVKDFTRYRYSSSIIQFHPEYMTHVCPPLCPRRVSTRKDLSFLTRMSL